MRFLQKEMKVWTLQTKGKVHGFIWRANAKVDSAFSVF
jgi:hypothetical protein